MGLLERGNRKTLKLGNDKQELEWLELWDKERQIIVPPRKFSVAALESVL